MADINIAAQVHQETVPGHDGTPLATFVMGDGPVDFVLAPGLGTPAVSWKHIVERFQHNFRFLTWDARGTHGSGVPADLNALRVEDHTADLFVLAKHFGMKKFVCGGWSMGVQISLEACHQQPDRILALALINGAPGHLLSTAYGGIPNFDKVALAVLRFSRHWGGGVTPVVGWLLSQTWTLPLMRKLEIFTNNDAFFKEMVAPFAALDFGIYFHMMALTHEHTAVPYLDDVRVPTLVTAGTKDLMTPVATAEAICAHIPHAELFIVPNGTHYTIAEYPEILNLRLERFFRDYVKAAKIV